MTDVHAATGYPPLPGGSPRTMPTEPLLADGCYYVAYGQNEPWYEGTLRVESRAGQLFASGDLYVDAERESDVLAGEVPPRAPGIPIFRIGDYTYYLRVTKIEHAEPGFNLSFEAHRYFPSTPRLLDGNFPPRWTLEKTVTVHMLPTNAPAGYPRPDQFYVGEIPMNDDPAQVARLQMGWVSSAFRKAVIEIDCTSDTHVPMDNGAGVTWQSAFRSFGWDAIAIDSDHNVSKSSAAPLWIAADAEAAMRQHRDSHDLDSEWRYYVLLVPQIFAPLEADGFMFHERREALFVGAHSMFPDQLQFGAVRGKRLDTTNEFFRVVMHELGHAMGLGHNETGFRFMRPTPSIAQDATADKPFPTNIEWSFDAADENRLRHWPDIAVRPGGVNEGEKLALLPPARSA